MFSRRDLFKQAGLTLLSYPFWHSSISWAQNNITLPSNKKFIFIFLRGAMDGLSLLPPIDDENYLKARPHIGLPKNILLNLNSPFGLHPGAASLKKYWDDGTLSFLTQVGSSNPTRSHFDAQDFMEAGTLSDKNIAEGLLNRALQELNPEKQNPLNGVAIQSTMPRILQGAYPAVSMNSLKDFRLKAPGQSGHNTNGFESMFGQATDQVFRGVSHDIFDSLKIVKGVGDNQRPGHGKAPGNKQSLSHKLQDIAAMINANIGLQVAVTEMSGWDTHVNQGQADGQLSVRFKELATSLDSFIQNLGKNYQDTCILVMTEFGRTMKENGNQGTDHGHGSVAMVLGGAVKGKKIYGQWKELKAENLYEDRDVSVSTDYRLIFDEILSKHLQLKNREKIFPGANLNSSAHLGFL